MDRKDIIIRTSLKGIILNIFLVCFKAIVGFLANSIAIVLDAVNNLSDAISAIITIIGAKLSDKAPDREHPYGHGRIEYFAATIISFIVLAAGVGALKESIEKIINPLNPHFEYYTLIVIIVATVAKFIFGKHVKKVGREINSQTLVATGEDAFMDAVLSLSTLVGALIVILLNVNIEGYLGVLISIMILKSAIGILKETIDTMIGERADSELTQKIKEKINSFEKVLGTYDLNLHNYGPEKVVGSCNIQVEDTLTAKEIHALTRQINKQIYKDFKIALTIGIYVSNDSGKSGEIKKEVEKIIADYKEILDIHGFYFDEELQEISFDLIFDFKCSNRKEIKREIINKINSIYPDFKCNVILDSDVSD